VEEPGKINAGIKRGGRKYIKTKGTDLSNKILKVMHIQPPKTVLTVEEFSG